MNPKQKSDELIAKFTVTVGMIAEHGSMIEYGKILPKSAIKCAIIAVEEIIEAIPKGAIWNECYWQEVLTELKSRQ